VAELVWGGEEDRRDMLRLLAMIATASGIKGVEDYQPPSEALAGWLAEPVKGPPTEEDRELRRLQVMNVAEALGGDVG
jgi:hypothetical protein